MTTPTWPNTLPALMDQTTLTIGASDAGVAVQRAENGEEIRRARSSHREDSYAAEFRMSDAEYAAFQTFWETTLTRGVRRFKYADPVSGTTVLMRFEAENAWSARRVGTRWHVSGRLIRRL